MKSKHLALVASVVTLLLSHTTLAQTTEEQLHQLADQVQKLEQRIQALEAQRSQNTVAATQQVEASTPWQRLKIGMSYEQVEKVIGKPVEVQKGLAEYWYYSDKRREGPHLKFLFSKLDSWKAP